MNQGSLFQPAPPEPMPLGLHQRAGYRGPEWAWTCPHCGAGVSAERDTVEEIIADPACCYCRAEFAGMTIGAFRRLARTERVRVTPDADWRSARQTRRVAIEVK